MSCSAHHVPETLRRHPLDRDLALPGLGVGEVGVHVTRQPEVGDLADSSLRHQHVPGGKVAVDNLTDIKVGFK